MAPNKSRDLRTVTIFDTAKELTNLTAFTVLAAAGQFQALRFTLRQKATGPGESKEKPDGEIEVSPDCASRPNLCRTVTSLTKYALQNHCPAGTTGAPFWNVAIYMNPPRGAEALMHCPHAQGTTLVIGIPQNSDPLEKTQADSRSLYCVTGLGHAGDAKPLSLKSPFLLKPGAVFCVTPSWGINGGDLDEPCYLIVATAPLPHSSWRAAEAISHCSRLGFPNASALKGHTVDTGYRSDPSKAALTSNATWLVNALIKKSRPATVTAQKKRRASWCPHCSCTACKKMKTITDANAKGDTKSEA